MADSKTEEETEGAGKRSRDEDDAEVAEAPSDEPPRKVLKTEEDPEGAKDEGKEETTETVATADNTEADDPGIQQNTDSASATESAPRDEVTSKETSTVTQTVAQEEGDATKSPPTQDSSTPAASVPEVSATVPVPGGLPPGLPVGDGQPSSALPPISANQPPADNPDAVVEEKGEVSALYVGRVIGKGGEMIRDLQARSGARIDVDQNVPPGMPRVITYRGTRKTVDFAKQLVHMLCHENVNEADLPLGEAKREYLRVPASSVGKIIGRGGEMIRELQNRSHAKIQVDHTGGGVVDPTEKQVTVTGTEQAVIKGKEMVLFLVANPYMDAMQSLNMLIEDKVQRGGVWGSGPPYPNLPQNGQNMQPQSASNYGYDQQSYYGSGAQGGAPGYGVQAAPYGGGGAYGAAAPAPSYQQPVATSLGGGMESEIFFAAKTYMGRIIGSKGVTINDLQRRSACDIQINQDVPPGRDCEITIRGTRQGIDMVKQMLREIIEIGPNHPYAGGGGGGAQSSYGGYQQGGYGMQNQGYGGYQAQSYGGRGGYDQQAYGQPSYVQPGGYAGGQQYPPAGQFSVTPPAPYGASPAPPVSDWKTATAPDGQIYYYNERTGETTWQKPPGVP